MSGFFIVPIYYEGGRELEPLLAANSCTHKRLSRLQLPLN